MALVCMFPEEPDLETEEQLNPRLSIPSSQNVSMQYSSDDPVNETLQGNNMTKVHLNAGFYHFTKQCQREDEDDQEITGSVIPSA